MTGEAWESFVDVSQGLAVLALVVLVLFWFLCLVAVVDASCRGARSSRPLLAFVWIPPIALCGWFAWLIGRAL